MQFYLKRFDGVTVSETMIRETAERCGNALVKAEEQYAENIREQKDVPAPEYQKPTERQYVMIDGGMVPTRPKKGGKRVEYKEAKIALVFREEDIERNKKDECRIIRKRYASSIAKGVKHFEALVRGLSLKIGAWHARQVIFVTDGAEWIDQLRRRLFPNSIHILDWYHAEEHLWECAKTIFGERNQKRTREWVRPFKNLLWNGGVEELCELLLSEIQRYPKKETCIRELYSYYHSRIEKMNYPEFRRQGLFIGSGSVESCMKYLIQSRIKQAGMKWNVSGATAILKLREKIYEQSWEAIWGARRRNFSYI